jgi:hypothetical protein
MKVNILVVSFAGILACSQGAAAQAISQGILLNQQSMQNADSAQGRPAQVISHTAAPEASRPANLRTYDSSAPQSSFQDPGRSRQPYFSEFAGYIAPGTQLVISNPNPAATIYYTTDGWTPTEDSLRYEHPITINSDTRVQAFAVEPGMLPSPMTDATFIVKPQQPLKPKNVFSDDGVLHRGTALRLVTGINARSDTTQVGDTLLLKLDQNVMVGDTVAVAKGSLGKGTITRVERAGRNGQPGLISFKVESLDAHGISIPLNANLTLAAPDIAAQAVKLSNPSAVRVSGPLPKGDEAAIEPGMPLTAIVAADTPLVRP